MIKLSELVGYIEKNARELGFPNVGEYEFAVLNWNGMIEESDLPYGFIYALDISALDEAIVTADPEILRNHIKARSS